MKKELTYWFTLGMIRGISNRRKNEIYSACYRHEPPFSIEDLFEKEEVWKDLGMTLEEINLFRQAKTELSSNAFIVENLLSQGYEILPLDSSLYPKTLKKNLKMGCPTIIYIKGDSKLLNEPAVAIVGSRKAEGLSLKFTDNVAAKTVKEGKVIVSGFAKGVDREALDGALLSGGKSIIVLPQGITTFSSGFKQYYQQIQQGKVLVMSVFEPQAGWNAGLAMARNSIIYGMADKIYVAESDSKGGTWSGVIDGLKKGREIFVRVPEKDEKNANKLLIEKGANPVDINGNPREYAVQGTLDFASEPSERYKESNERKVSIQLSIDFDEERN